LDQELEKLAMLVILTGRLLACEFLFYTVPQNCATEEQIEVFFTVFVAGAQFILVVCRQLKE
jgi:hypothetical protein